MAKRSTIDRSRLALIGIALVAVLFLAVNYLAGTLLTSTRLDLTEDRLYTVSDGTKQVLGAIEEPIDVRFYYSDELKEVGAYFATYANRVSELLDEYARLSGGKIRIERLDPEPFSQEEDLAVAEGLQGIPISNDGEQSYFGLSGRNSTDDLQVIPYLAPERADFLEYDLTRVVHDLANPDKPVVGVLGDLPLMGTQFNQGQPWMVLDAMFQFFDVRFLGGNQKSIEPEVEVLLLAQPQQLDPPSLYAIDQFVMRGGRILALVDPYSEALEGQQNPMAPPPAGGSAVEALKPLLAAWGVEVTADKVIGDAQAAQRVGARINGREAVVQYLPWLGLGRANLDPNAVVTAELQRLNLNSVGAIHGLEGAGTTIEPLVQSSAQAMEIDAANVRGMPDPGKLIAEFVPSGESYTLAARVQGQVSTAFPDGPPEGADEALAQNQIKEAEQPLQMILIADSDFLADQNWVRQQSLLGRSISVPIANNADFAVNALDNLSGSEGLVGLRGRGLSLRPFEVVEAMAQDAELKFRAKEQELLGRIDETQQKIRDLQQQEQQSGVILTAEQQTAIEDFRAEMIGLRQELRAVQRSLREDVEHLASWIKAINIFAVPLLIGLVAIVLAVLRRMRAARFVAAASEG